MFQMDLFGPVLIQAMVLGKRYAVNQGPMVFYPFTFPLLKPFPLEIEVTRRMTHLELIYNLLYYSTSSSVI
jgi:hypothetical protein